MNSQSLNFSDTVTLITGAGRGNGAALARGYAKAGSTVLVIDIDAQAAHQTAAELTASGATALGYALDIRSEQDCCALAERIEREIGPISTLVNNAGLLFRGPFEDASTPDRWRQTVDVNVTGMLNMTHAFLGQLKKSQGSVLNIASICSFAAGVELSTYAASKGAVLQLTRALASELAEQGVRVNGIAPGSFPTAMSAATREDASKLQSFLNHVPMGRTGEPDELIGPALFLSSALASYITGAMLPVDGGYLTR